MKWVDLGGVGYHFDSVGRLIGAYAWTDERGLACGSVNEYGAPCKVTSEPVEEVSCADVTE